MYRKAFFAICLNGFALAFTWGITVTNIPWLFDRVGIKETDLGIWFTIFAVLQLIFSQLSGRVIVPLIGTTKTLMLGQLSFAIFPYIFITASNIQIFFLSSIPLSIAAGLIFPTIASSTNFIENKTKRIYQTYQQASFSFGFIISGIFASLFFYLNLYPPHIFIGLIFFLTLIIILTFIFGLSSENDYYEKLAKFKIPERKVLFFGLNLAIFMGTVGIMLEWTPLWLKRDLNASLYVASLSILCWGGGEFIGRIYGEKIVNAYGVKFAAGYFGLVGCLIFFISILTANIYIIILAVFLFALSTSNFYPVVLMQGLKYTNESISITAANITTIAFSGFLIGPAIIGFSAETFGLTFNVIALCFIWAFNGLLFIYFINQLRK